MKYWASLIFASLLEICWMYSLKFIDKSRLSAIQWKELFYSIEPWKAIFPVLGYVIFGLGNVLFFSFAMKKIPPSLAFAIWMGLALTGSIVIDYLFFNQSLSWIQILFLLLITIGIIGLKATFRVN
ncbi:MAG: SMR family transporter [Bacteroidia bacterium]|nr:SMR family transporter [Bacteroidia bacterium]MDW8159578.1 SMR family transporter [Bacteroidia bacterium]